MRNVIVVAGDGAAAREGLPASRWQEVRQRSPRAPDLSRAIADRWAPLLPTADVPLLTDDYAPTDALLLLLG